ncbi:MAG: hypothetical protein A3K18_12760 [Lentisphaerae bacterium RIFOXYA12_64_32]|nr:MAG: hypothetical protein A3K18_12760 [Lentisphaerae bacterium RIFOXYA12_64_32]
MKTWLKILVGVAVVVQAGVAWAGDGPWTLRLGASYRDFDDVDFKGVDFRNLGTALNPAGPYGVQDVTTVPGNVVGTAVILDYLRWNGSSAGVDRDDKWAPVIGFGYDLRQAGKLRLALVGNFQYYHLETGTYASGNAVVHDGFSLEQYQHYVVDAPGTLIPGLAVGGVTPGTIFAVRNQFEMDLYVLDLGLEARTTMDRFNFTFALGPTLTITDAESSQRQQASWLAQGPGISTPGPVLPCPPQPLPQPAGGSYAREESESDTDFLLGAYVALGVTVKVSTSWFVGLEYRYDHVSGDAGTRQAELDLCGSSGILRLAYRF